jgi:hypothetical protein
MSDEAMETPLEELMESDLKHYDELSSAACVWHSGIPTAIRYYAIDRPKLEKENSTHIMMRDVIKEELKKVMEENNSLTESLAKYKDLFDPHNLLDL